jgi:hypothetical protein
MSQKPLANMTEVDGDVQQTNTGKTYHIRNHAFVIKIQPYFAEMLSLRRRVLEGGFSGMDSSVWVPIVGKLMVFFSSTFTDTHRERDILQKETLKKLQLHAKSENVVVSFVDMRWGVKDENTLDHQTWTACSREIERCRAESDGIFFVSLQSEK